MGTQGYPIGATQTALSVIEFLSENGGAGVTEISNALDCSKSTVFNQLRTLEQRGYIVQEETEYKLGYRFLTHGLRVRRGSAIVPVAKNRVDDLAKTTGELVSLVVQQHDVVYHLYQSHDLGDQGVPVEVGEFESLWSSAGGQVISSYLSDEYVAQLSGQQAESESQMTAHQKFDSMGDRRIAFSNRERDKVWQTIAAPILTLDDDPIGAIEVIGLGDELSGRASEVEVPGLVLNAVKSIEKNIMAGEI
jgi:DNA-binding IclR family transcriptional regulator